MHFPIESWDRAFLGFGGGVSTDGKYNISLNGSRGLGYGISFAFPRVTSVDFKEHEYFTDKFNDLRSLYGSSLKTVYEMTSALMKGNNKKEKSYRETQIIYPKDWGLKMIRDEY